MEYAIDTAALVRYNTNQQLGQNARVILEGADEGNNTILIPIIDVFEIMYLAEKKRITFTIEELKKLLQKAKNYKIIDLDIDIVLIAQNLANYQFELHDRLIIATALKMNVPLITSDRMITDSGVVEIIWK